jgi:hypothetical protein
MRCSVWLLAAILVGLATPSARADGDDVDEVSPDILAALQNVDDAAQEQGKGDDGNVSSVSYRVPVHLHVVRAFVGDPVSDIPVASARQMTVDDMNAAFSNVPGNVFSFELVSIDYITSAKYARVTKEDSSDLASTYNLGGRDHLNIYITIPTIPDDHTGAYSRFPWTLGATFILFRQTSGRPTAAGHAAAHEAGHWLGLMHTFYGGCWGGDFIDDTPPMDNDDVAMHACGENDSCPYFWGNDPTDNLMGYAWQCRGTFTPGQMARMKWSWRNWRGGGKADGDLDEDGQTTTTDAGCAVAPGGRGKTAGGFAVLLLVAALCRRRRSARA